MLQYSEREREREREIKSIHEVNWPMGWNSYISCHISFTMKEDKKEVWRRDNILEMDIEKCHVTRGFNPQRHSTTPIWEALSNLSLVHIILAALFLCPLCISFGMPHPSYCFLMSSLLRCGFMHCNWVKSVIQSLPSLFHIPGTLYLICNHSVYGQVNSLVWVLLTFLMQKLDIFYCACLFNLAVVYFE